MHVFGQQGLEMDFPCHFPLKVVGPMSQAFLTEVYAIALRNDPTFTEVMVTHNQSRGAKYQSVTLAIQATSKEQLDTLYRELKACESVLWAI